MRQLKADKAAKKDIDDAVKILLNLKTQYKTLTGKDWKPLVKPSPEVDIKLASPQTGSEADILNKINLQGDKVRVLKGKKAAKAEIDAEVKVLLDLKGQYKNLTGKEWKPGTVASSTASSAPAPAQSTTVPTTGSNEAEILTKIAQQGEKVRDLKAKKADKASVDAEVKTLLDLKSEYKAVTGKEWKPGTVASTPAATTQSPAPSAGNTEEELLTKIVQQGDKVRELKSKKADKASIDAEVKTLLDLKTQYKAVTGKEWKPGNTTTPPSKDRSPPKTIEQPKTDNMASTDVQALTDKVNEQGNTVRDLKSKKASKDEIDAAVKALLELKAEYKKLTGIDFPTGGRAPAKPAGAVKKEQPKPAPKIAPVKAQKDDAQSGTGVKKVTRLGLEAKKEENLPDWYSQVITKGEMIEYYDVSGCYILRHWSFAIWKSIKTWFDAEITKLGVKEAYFPIFVSKAALEREKSHIADFAPEVAWVTKSGDSDLAEPIAVRPTSETVMYPAYAKWIQSYRDLPIRLNQWNNVVRWEFKHPQPFLRTREFLWQEGHTAFATDKEAAEEVLIILGKKILFKYFDRN